VEPVYPPLARQALIDGTVRFTAIIGGDGHILNLQLVSGHPLLVPAAQDAVRQWVYRPTLLNGTPVEVVTQIDVPFTLSNSR
jgi:protein TonB